MDYEKKYKESMAKMSTFLAKHDGLTISKYSKMYKELSEIFPELKESKSERIWIINYLSNRILNSTIIAEKENLKKAIAWLEKQGEQTPADKVEPKFHEDDWIVNKGHSYLIADIDYEQRRYLFEIGGYTHEQLNWEYIANADNKYHLWTIQDAKDGDVLELDCGIGIFKDKCIDGYNIHCYCYYSNEGVLEINKDSLYDTYQSHPTTKEQRDQLEKAMTNAGYTFDFEKKELKKLEDEPYQEMLDKAIELYYYTYGNGKGGFDNLSLEKFKDIVKTFVNDYSIQNYAWSDEDEKVS